MRSRTTIATRIMSTSTSPTSISTSASASGAAASNSRHRRDGYVLLLGCCSLFVLGCSWTIHHGLLNLDVFNQQHYDQSTNDVHHRRVRSNSIASEYERNLYSDLEKSRIVNNNNNIPPPPPPTRTTTTTTSESLIQQQEDNRPHFVIHVGPHNTGTTFLQASFDMFKINRNILRHDNYTYLRVGAKSIFEGNGNSSSCWNDNNNDDDDKNGDGPQYHAHKHAESASLMTRSLRPRFKPSFQNVLYKLHAQGQHVLLISQGFSKCNVAHVKALADLLNPLFNVRILVAYRRLYEWLPSRFHQVTNGIGDVYSSGSLQQEPGRRSYSRIDHLWPDQVLFLKDNSNTQPLSPHYARRRTRTRRGRTTRRVAAISTGTNGQQQKEDMLHFEQGAVVMRPFDLDHAHSLDYTNNNATAAPVEFTKLVQSIYKLQQHPAEMIRDKYQLFFRDVQVLPLHALHYPFRKTNNNNNNNQEKTTGSTPSLVSHSHVYHLVCSFLPHAKYTCWAAQQGLLQGTWKGTSNNSNINIISKNKSSPLSSTTTATSVDHDAIAVAAYQKGWIDAHHSRVDVVQQIARYAHEMKQASMVSSQSLMPFLSNQTAGLNNGHDNDDTANSSTAAAAAVSPTSTRMNDNNNNNNSLDQFYTCPSNATLHRLLQLSVDTERHLFGNNVVKAGQWQEHHRHAFMTDAMQEYNSYCWINVTAVLDNDSWQFFLQSLGGKKKNAQSKRMMIRSLSQEKHHYQHV